MKNIEQLLPILIILIGLLNVIFNAIAKKNDKKGKSDPATPPRKEPVKSEPRPRSEDSPWGWLDSLEDFPAAAPVPAPVESSLEKNPSSSSQRGYNSQNTSSSQRGGSSQNSSSQRGYNSQNTSSSQRGYSSASTPNGRESLQTQRDNLRKADGTASKSRKSDEMMKPSVAMQVDKSHSGAASSYGAFFRDRDDLKRAVVMKEILSRKYR